MPTIANASVVGHLYAAPELKKNDHGSFCRVRLWTSDKIKGQEERAFTSWSGLVNGIQAEWLCRDAKKGDMVYVAGTIRLGSYKKDDGTEAHSIDFVRVSEARLLERREKDESSNAAPTKPIKAQPVAGADESEPPF